MPRQPLIIDLDAIHYTTRPLVKLVEPYPLLRDDEFCTDVGEEDLRAVERQWAQWAQLACRENWDTHPAAIPECPALSIRGSATPFLCQQLDLEFTPHPTSQLPTGQKIYQPNTAPCNFVAAIKSANNVSALLEPLLDKEHTPLELWTELVRSFTGSCESMHPVVLFQSDDTVIVTPSRQDLVKSVQQCTDTEAILDALVDLLTSYLCETATSPLFWAKCRDDLESSADSMWKTSTVYTESQFVVAAGRIALGFVDRDHIPCAIVGDDVPEARRLIGLHIPHLCDDLDGACKRVGEIVVRETGTISRANLASGLYATLSDEQKACIPPMCSLPHLMSVVHCVCSAGVCGVVIDDFHGLFTDVSGRWTHGQTTPNIWKGVITADLILGCASRVGAAVWFWNREWEHVVERDATWMVAQRLVDNHLEPAAHVFVVMHTKSNSVNLAPALAAMREGLPQMRYVGVCNIGSTFVSVWRVCV